MAEETGDDGGGGGDEAGFDDHVEVGVGEASGVGEELADVNLRSDAGAEGAEAAEVADEEGSGDQGELGAGAVRGR